MKMSDVRSRRSCALARRLCGRAAQGEGLVPSRRADKPATQITNSRRVETGAIGKNMATKAHLLLPYDCIAADKVQLASRRGGGDRKHSPYDQVVSQRARRVARTKHPCECRFCNGQLLKNIFFRFTR